MNDENGGITKIVDLISSPIREASDYRWGLYSLIPIFTCLYLVLIPPYSYVGFHNS